MLRKKKYLSVLCIVVTLIAGVILGVWQTIPPRIRKTSHIYPAYERMMDNLQQMAVEPRPSGSKENEIVRAQILAEIENMGLTPTIQSTMYTLDEMIEKLLADGGVSSIDEFWEAYHEDVAQLYGIYSLDEFIDDFLGDMFSEDGNLPLHNIIVKLDANDSGCGVLFAAHYDSVPEGPGAADNMLGVVSILEALRSQAQNDARKNDLYFLFTDGEELGLLGANKFVEAHPELNEQISLVINIDSRGNRGALMLYDTSPHAYRLVATIKKSAAWLYGYSIASKVQSMMPNDTDLSAFLKNGYNGLNFAAIEGVKAYHTMEDNYENINPATAWHHMQVIVSIVDYTANNSLEDLHKPSRDAVFFPFLPGGMVLITDIVSHILCAVACASALTVGMLNLRKKQQKPSLSTTLMSLLVLASIICSIFFVAGSYLLYIPLFLIALSSLAKKWPKVHLSAKMVTGIVVLMLWVPGIIATWWALIAPMYS